MAKKSAPAPRIAAGGCPEMGMSLGGKPLPRQRAETRVEPKSESKESRATERREQKTGREAPMKKRGGR